MDPNDLMNPANPLSPVSPMNPASPLWIGNSDTQNATSAADGEVGALIAVCILGFLIVYCVVLYVYDWWNGKIF